MRVSAVLRLSRSDDFADAAFGVAVEERCEVVAHPGAADFACDAISVLWRVEVEQQDEVRVVDLGHAGCEPACVDHLSRRVLECFPGRVGHGIAKVEVMTTTCMWHCLLVEGMSVDVLGSLGVSLGGRGL